MSPIRKSGLGLIRAENPRLQPLSVFRMQRLHDCQTIRYCRIAKQLQFIFGSRNRDLVAHGFQISRRWHHFGSVGSNPGRSQQAVFFPYPIMHNWGHLWSAIVVSSPFVAKSHACGLLWAFLVHTIVQYWWKSKNSLCDSNLWLKRLFIVRQ